MKRLASPPSSTHTAKLPCRHHAITGVGEASLTRIAPIAPRSAPLAHFSTRLSQGEPRVKTPIAKPIPAPALLTDTSIFAATQNTAVPRTEPLPSDAQRQLEGRPMGAQSRTLTRRGPLLFIVAGMALLGIAGCAGTASRTTDTCTGSPKVLLQRFTDAFNEHDAPALAAIFSSDASFVNIYGERMKGRVGIESGHRHAFENRLVVANLVMKDIEKQELAPDEFVLYGSWDLAQPDGTDTSTAVPAGSGILTAVAQCASGQWQLRAATNVRQTTPPS